MKKLAFTLFIASLFLTVSYANNISDFQLGTHSIDITNPWDIDEMEIGQIIELKDLRFAMDESKIEQDSKTNLVSLGNFLKENELVQIELRGHTNSTPDHDYCDRLSESRAESVKQYLVSLGASSDNIITKGYGKRHPKYSNSNAATRKLNQRVELRILAL